MNISRLIVICSILFFLTVGISAASDLNDSDVVLQSDQGSFNELQDLIDNSAENSVLNLTKDYLSDNNAFPEGVKINKALTINGNDHVIDANFNSRIFHISSSGVVLNNIKFVNGKSSSEGGAIKSTHGGTINSCIFENNFANTDGGALYLVNAKVYNSSFINNSVSCGNVTDSKGTVLGYGGAIYQENSNVYNSAFIANSAFNGGAIEQGHSNIYNSTFINNSAVDGGAVVQFGGSTVHGSTFISNGFEVAGYISANGGAIWQMEKSKVYDSIFINNSAYYGGAINQENSDVYNSEFTGNSALYGGAVYQEDNSNVYDSNFSDNYAEEHGGAVYQRQNSNVYNSTFENNLAGNGCDDICNHDNSTFSEDIAYEDLNDEFSFEVNENKLIDVDDKNSTGNPLVLLLLCLFAIIIRIEK